MPANDNPVIDQVSTKIQAKDLNRLVDRVLKNREKLVVQMRFGLNNYEPKTQREVAQILDISRSYVSRIEKKALERLHQEFEKNDK